MNINDLALVRRLEWRVEDLAAEVRHHRIGRAGRYSLAIQQHQQQVFLAQLVALRSNVIAAILALKKVCP